jgi:hypothetical protein
MRPLEVAAIARISEAIQSGAAPIPRIGYVWLVTEIFGYQKFL